MGKTKNLIFYSLNLRHLIIIVVWIVWCITDVFSYDEDDMVEDPKLAEHLAHFGINMMIMEKVSTTTCFRLDF